MVLVHLFWHSDSTMVKALLMLHYAGAITHQKCPFSDCLPYIGIAQTWQCFVNNRNYWCPAQLCGESVAIWKRDGDVGVSYVPEQRKQLYPELLQQHRDIA